MRRPSLLRASALCLCRCLCGVALAAAGAASAQPLSVPVNAGDDAERAARLGARVESAFAQGVTAAACQGVVVELQQALSDPKRQSARAGAARALARCEAAQGNGPGAASTFAQATQGALHDEVFLLEEAAQALAPFGLQGGAVLAHLDTLRVSARDTDRREALGRALALLLQTPKLDAARQATLERRLLIELSDTAAGTAFAATAGGKARAQTLSLKETLERATALDSRHESQAVIDAFEQLAQRSGANRDTGVDKDTTADTCAARLLRGKAWRKLRKYAQARADLDHVATRCDDDTKKRAGYLQARVAFIQGTAQADALLSSFVATWGADPLVDDVLFWSGERKAARGDIAGAQAAWQRIVDEHPTGDMIHEARFALAFSTAAGGGSVAADAARARALLDEAARNAGARTDVADRALYWRARLAYAPTVDSLAPNPDDATRREGIAALLATAISRPASFYGHLARLLVQEATRGTPAAVDVEKALGDATPLGRGAALGKSVSATLPPALFASLSEAQALVQQGFFTEARWLAEAAASTSSSGPERLVAAQLLVHAGDPGAAHGALRDAGMALLPGSPGSDSVVAWNLSWPRAYAAEIDAAAGEAKIPTTLLMGLSREESAFDAAVVSWAGAVGLCQLMPPTAKEEAQGLKLKPPSVEELRAPALNARLGAAHLGRRLRGMKHPLLAIAAYNAGPGGVARWMPKDKRALPLDFFVEEIPVEETRNYVKKVTGSWVTYSALDGRIDDVTFPLVVQ